LKKILFFLIFPILAWSQELSFVKKTSLDADTFIGVDSYNDLFYIKNQTLYKKTDTNLFNFKNFQLGAIKSVDIINPMNIVVYYSDFNTVILLDNKLTEIERINFNNLSEIINTSTATLAANTSLWLFNVDSQQLESYNYRSKNKVLVSQPINGELLSQASNYNFCFVLTEDKIRAYNIYGSLITEINNDGFEKIVQSNENIIALKDNELYYIDKKAAEITKIKSPEINIKDLQLKLDLLYIYDGKQVHIFKLTIPK